MAAWHSLSQSSTARAEDTFSSKHYEAVPNEVRDETQRGSTREFAPKDACGSKYDATRREVHDTTKKKKRKNAIACGMIPAAVSTMKSLAMKSTINITITSVAARARAERSQR